MDISGKPKFISTFCGTGGSSLGYKLAGYQGILSIDFDPHAVECYRANFPDTPCWLRSIYDLSAENIFKFTGLKKGELDLFDGSPPCQGFSLSGKRNVTDKRNNLFLEYTRLVNDLAPKVFVMENVAGMVSGKMKGKFIEIMSKLKALNYNVKCKLMNSKYYGVPQSRPRLIFIGVRKDLGKDPIFPIPNTKVITCGEALKDYEESEKPNRKYITPGLKKYAMLLQQGESASKYHPTGSLFGLIRLNENKPCNTIIKSAGTGLLHYKDNLNFLSVNELKILCSFPIDWKLGDSRGKAIDRLGNAVMPRFMEKVALTIKEEILEK